MRRFSLGMGWGQVRSHGTARWRGEFLQSIATELARSYRVAAVPRMRTERALRLDACLVTFAS